MYNISNHHISPIFGIVPREELVNLILVAFRGVSNTVANEEAALFAVHPLLGGVLVEDFMDGFDGSRVKFSIDDNYGVASNGECRFLGDNNRLIQLQSKLMQKLAVSDIVELVFLSQT